MRDPQDALDVLQKTFLYLLKKFRGFRPKARPTTFLYPAVKHLARNRRRMQHGLTTTASARRCLCPTASATTRP